MDFAEVDQAVRSAVLDGPTGMDHADLNELVDNPTAERIAVEIGHRLDTVGLG